MIDIKYIKQLLDALDKSSVHSISLETDGEKIKLSKENKKVSLLSSSSNFGELNNTNQQLSATPITQVPLTQIVSELPKAVVTDDKKYHEVLSPIVGTFYRSASPDSASFVEIGSMVSPGSTLCIVEAMKLMNEIESESYGKIAKILVENGKPVEYNQVLFLIEPTS